MQLKQKTQTIEKYKKAQAEIENDGVMVGVAAKKWGLNYNNFQTWRKRNGLQTPMEKKKIKSARLVTLPQETASTSKMMLIVGTREEISNILRGAL